MTSADDDPQRRADQLRRLLPLLPQLAMGIQRNRGEISPELASAGSLGSRHVAALISLTLNGPATVSTLAERLDISLNHASLVTRELHRDGLLERREDADDRRRVIVAVAPEHARQVLETTKRASSPLRAFLATLTPDEAETFLEQVSALLGYLNGSPEFSAED